MFLKQVFKGISEKIYKGRINRKFKGKNAEKLFSIIPPAAIDVLIEMYDSPTHSKILNFGGSIATMLQNPMFITCGQVSVMGMEFEYFLQPWVVEYLNKNIDKYR